MSDAARDDHPDDAHHTTCYDGAVLQAPNDPLSSGREANLPRFRTVEQHRA